MEITLTIWSFIFVFAAFQGLIIIGLFLMSKTKRQFEPNIWVIALTLCFSCLILIYVAYWNRLVIRPQFLRLNQLYWPFLFAIPPLFYLYINALTEQHKYKLIHLSAPFLVLVSWLPFYFMPADQKVNYLKQYALDQNLYYQLGSFLNWTILFYLSVYLFLSIKAVKGFKKHINPRFLSHSLFDWFNTLLWAYGVFVIGHILYFVLVDRFGFPIEWDYGISLVMCFMIYLIGYKSYSSPELFLEREKLEAQQKRKNIKLIPDVKSQLIISNLKNIMTSEKPFLNDQLKLTDLANRLEVSSHGLSYIINKKLQTTFNDYINGHRIDHAKFLLEDPNNKKLKIADIAYQSGFNSRTSFYNTFKRFTKTTPTSFRSKVLSNQTAL